MLTKARQSPSSDFIQSIEAGIDYWQTRTRHLSPDTIIILDQQCQNLYRLVQFGLKLPQTWEGAATIALQAFDLVEQRGYWQEWILVMEQAIAGCTDENPRLKFRLLNRLGQLHRLNRQLSASINIHQAAKTIAHQLGDEHLLARVYYNLSEAHLRRHEYDEAERYGVEALSIFKNIEGEEKRVSAVLNALGETARFRGDLAVAEKRLSQAVEISRTIGQSIYLVRFLNNLALTLQAAEKFDEALWCLTDAAAVLETITSEFDKTMTQINLGLLHFKQKQWAEAEAAFRRADSSFLQRSGHIYYRALIANNLGNTLLKQKRLTEAETYLRHAIQLWQQASDNLELANTLGSLAEVLVAQRQVDSAIPLYNKAITLLQQFPDDAWARQLLKLFRAQRQALSTG